MDGLVVVESVQIALELGTALVTGWLVANRHEMKSLQNENKKIAADIVKAELANHTTPLKSSIDSLEKTIKSIQDRLSFGEGIFDKLNEHDQRAELKSAQILGDLKVFMANTFCTKVDLEKHQEKVDRQLDGLSAKQMTMATDLAVVAAGVKNHG